MYLQLARRNDWTYSEQLDNAAWTKTRTTITADAVAAPNGTTTADKIVEDSSVSTTHFLQRNAPTHTADTDQTVSGFVKAAERVALRFDLLNKAGNSYVVDFQLSTATKAEVSGTGTSTFRDVGDGWYRFIITQDSESGGSTPRLNIVLKSGGVISYTGDGSSGAYAWGIQFEVDQSSVGGYASTEATAFTTGVDGSPLLDGSSITWDAAQKMSEAVLTWNADAATFSISHGKDVIVDSHGTTKFVGQVVNFSYRKDSHRPGQMLIRATCLDHVHRLATTEVGTGSGSVYKGSSDRAVYQGQLSDTGLDTYITSDNANVDIVKSSIDIAFSSDTMVREAFDLVASRAGAEWSLDPNIAPATKVALHYNTEANAGNAAWDVSDSPSAPTTYDVESLVAESVYDEPGNDIVVVGGLDTFGRRIKATDSDATSISTYGTKRRRFSSDSITTQEFADDVAAALLAKHKDPYWVASYGTKVDGLHVNELQDVTNSDYGLSSESMFIRRLEARQIKGGPDDPKTQYRVHLGPDRSSSNRLLRQVASLSIGPNSTPLLLRGINVTGTNGFFVVGTGTTTLEDLYQDASGGITISAWIRSDTTITDYGGILTAAASSEAEDDGWSFNIESGGGVRFLRFQAGTASTHLSYKYASNFPEADGLWHHCLVTWNGITGTSPDSDVKIYFDGVESTTRTSHGVGSWVQDVSANMSMGPVKDMGLAQICAWNIELGDGDIQRLAARPDSTIPTSIFPSHRICYYTLDGYADAVTIPKAVGEIQDRWNDFHAETDVTTSGDFGTGEDSHWTPLL